MSGRFIPTVRFPIYVEDCKSARVQVEPIFCQAGYGVEIKVILVLTKGTDRSKYEYERLIASEIITQSTLPDGSFYETAFEYFEGFYYNKISQDVVVPLTAMILKVYFSDLIERCALDLSDYFLDIESSQPRAMGYQRG